VSFRALSQAASNYSPRAGKKFQKQLSLKAPEVLDVAESAEISVCSPENTLQISQKIIVQVQHSLTAITADI
jgi:hypothetical protein